MASTGQRRAPHAANPGMVVPSPDHRLAFRQRPAGRAAGHQRWNHLLFAHWRVDPALVQATLPAGLFADTHEGHAYLGIVPFAMERMHPAGFPPLPWVSTFLELNVRTYVHDAAGRPGVWFYSLDCNQPLAVVFARSRYHLPYRHARMAADFHDRQIEYACERRDANSLPAHFEWRAGNEARETESGTLEFFLVERYAFYAADRQGRLHLGRVHHAPYRVHVPTLTRWSTEPARLAGFELEGPPVSVLGADAIDVTIFPVARCD